MMKVSVVSCDSYQEQQVYQAIKDAIAQIGFVMPKNKRILIKPNLMSQNKPTQHTVTHYALIDGLCRLCQENRNEILIGDSISFFQKGLTVKAFKTTKMAKVAAKYKAKLVPFEQCRLKKVVRDDQSNPDITALYIPEILYDVDLIIDACKLKTHSSMRFSGAIKNMFGVLPGGYKQHMHRWVNSEFELADVFIDIHKSLGPTLSIMDAIVSLDGGPTALGKPVKTGVVLASANSAALDFTAGKMIGYRIDEVPLFLEALKKKLISDVKDIEVIGQLPRYGFAKLTQTPLDLPYNKNSIFVTATYMAVKIKQQRCTNCQQCIEECPVNAIREVAGKITIDQATCINCYHCLYACKDNAVVIAPTLLNRLIWIIRKIIRL